MNKQEEKILRYIISKEFVTASEKKLDKIIKDYKELTDVEENIEIKEKIEEENE